MSDGENDCTANVDLLEVNSLKAEPDVYKLRVVRAASLPLTSNSLRLPIRLLLGR